MAVPKCIPKEVRLVEQIHNTIFADFIKQTNNNSPLSFLSSRLSQFTKATRIFTTRDYTHTNVAAEFHQACDNIPNTLVIIKSGQYIAGGYTEVAWSSPAEWVRLKAVKAFVFSVNRQKVYPVSEQICAIYCDRAYGPMFGGSALRIYGDYGDGGKQGRGGCSDMGYYDKTGVVNRDTELMGTEYFKVDEYEVYKLE